MDIIQQICVTRERANISRQALARAAGLYCNYLYKVDARRKQPSLGALKALAIALRDMGAPISPAAEECLGIKQPETQQVAS